MTDRKYWGVVSPMPAPVIAMQTKMAEDGGLEGIFAPQVYGPPWIPLAAAAATSQRVRLASGIAIAYVRSPFETAMAAIDMDRLSGGRFTLGLGTSVSAWTSGFYGVETGKPLTHMREVVDIVRTVVSKAHTGELKRYDGQYHNHDWTELQPTAPPVRTEIPIWIAAMRGPLVSLAAEIGDGVIGHPMWSIDWLCNQIPAYLKRGLDRGGKNRSQIEFNSWLWAAISDDRKQAIEDSKPSVAFYAGIAQYEEFFAAHGFRDEARRLQEAVKHGDYIAASATIPSEMVEAFVPCGTADEVRKRIEPAWDVVDSLTLVPPAYALTPDKLMAYAGAIAATFYG